MTDEEYKLPPVEPYTCPECGKTVMLARNANRQRCPECAYQHQREQAKIRKRERKHRGKSQARSDAEINARIRKTVVAQCRYCYYRRQTSLTGQNGIAMCEHLLETGMRVEKDENGKCLSFVPKDGKKRRPRRPIL